MKLAALSLIVLSLSTVTLFASSTTILKPSEVSHASHDRDSTGRSYGHMRGTVRAHQVLDSYSWIVQGEDGRWYDPVNLPDSLKAEGTRITFSYKETASWGYTYAGGELIELTQVARAK